jgi:hypothetical protein
MALAAVGGGGIVLLATGSSIDHWSELTSRA